MSDRMTTQIIKAVNDELMQSIEIVYVPFELDAQNQWMSPETIRKACTNFNENLEKGNVIPNMFHGKGEGEEAKYTSTENFEIVKSWINEVECTIGNQTVPEGTWISKLQWKEPAAWELRKSGTYQGVSIGAKAIILKPNETE